MRSWEVRQRHYTMVSDAPDALWRVDVDVDYDAVGLLNVEVWCTFLPLGLAVELQLFKVPGYTP